MPLCHECHEPIVKVGQRWQHEDKGQMHTAWYGSPRPNKNYILQVMRDEFGADDEWGIAISWAFAVAECLAVIGAAPPAELEYQPSPFVVVQSPEEYSKAVRSGQEPYDHFLVWEYLGYDTGLTLSRVEEVQQAGKILARYLDWLRAAGKDY